MTFPKNPFRTATFDSMFGDLDSLDDPGIYSDPNLGTILVVTLIGENQTTEKYQIKIQNNSASWRYYDGTEWYPWNNLGGSGGSGGSGVELLKQEGDLAIFSQQVGTVKLLQARGYLGAHYVSGIPTSADIEIGDIVGDVGEFNEFNGQMGTCTIISDEGVEISYWQVISGIITIAKESLVTAKTDINYIIFD